MRDETSADIFSFDRRGKGKAALTVSAHGAKIVHKLGIAQVRVLAEMAPRVLADMEEEYKADADAALASSSDCVPVNNL